MSVELDDAAIRSDWESGVGDVRTLALTPKSRASEAALTRVTRCMEEVNEASETQWLDLDDMPTVGRSPILAGGVVVWEIETQHPDGPIPWLTAFAAALEAAGGSGTIAPYRFDHKTRRFLNTMADGQIVPGVTLVLAWGRYGRNVNGFPEAQWKVDPGIIPVLTDLAATFLAPIPGHVSCEVGVGQTVDSALFELPDVLGRSLPAFIETPSAQRQGLHQGRRITFTTDGHVFLSVYADPSRLVDAAEDVCSLVQDTAALHCDWAALMENGGELALRSLYKWTGRGRLPTVWGRRREHDTEHVIDAFAWQMVGPKQLSKALDLSRWEIAPVGGLTVVRQADLAGWLKSDGGNPPRVALDEEALARIRRDFGPMIIPLPEQAP